MSTKGDISPLDDALLSNLRDIAPAVHSTLGRWSTMSISFGMAALLRCFDRLRRFRMI